MREFKSQIGFLTIAQNTTVDYLNLAYHQAKNIKATQSNDQYAVIVDHATLKQVTDAHREVFDHIIELPSDMAKQDVWKLSNEWQVMDLTPFKETIKLESDLLFTDDINHWLHALRLRDVCLSYNCRDYQGHRVTKTAYRKFFELNDLPDVYNGMMYFRWSQTAVDFFKTAKNIYANWNTIKQELLRCDQDPTTDVVYAITAKIIGIEKCLIPTLDFFNFAHMKPRIQGWSDDQPWTEHVNVEHDGTMIRINNLNQYHPVHYYEKDFIK